MINQKSSLVPLECQQMLIDRKYGMFIHFGINTFNNKEWSNGKLSVDTYNPSELDVESWIRHAYLAGMNYVVMIAKHHDGFCLWHTDTTDYSISKSPCKTDVIMEAKKACDKYGLKLCIYYSLWDRHEKCYKKHEQYTDYMLKHLDELLGGMYGEIGELWLDGGWDKRNNQWGVDRIYDRVKTLQPNCAMSVNVTIGKFNSKGGGVKKYFPENYLDRMPMKYFPSDFRLLDPHNTSVNDPKIYTHNGQEYYLPFEATICVRNMKRWFWGETYEKELLLSPQFVCDRYHHLINQQNALVINLAPDKRGKMLDSDVAVIMDAANMLGIQRA